jgi:hypothetical protein
MQRPFKILSFRENLRLMLKNFPRTSSAIELEEKTLRKNPGYVRDRVVFALPTITFDPRPRLTLLSTLSPPHTQLRQP